MHEKEEKEEKMLSRWWFGWCLDWAKRYCPIKIMWWFTEPTFYNLFSIYIFTIPNMNRIIQDPNMKFILVI